MVLKLLQKHTQPTTSLMKKILIFIASLIIMLLLGACSSLQTAFDYDKEANFSQYRTFAFYKEGMQQLKINDIDKKRFVQAILEDLEAKGMTKSVQNPDLLINVIITGKERTSISDDYTFGYGWWYPLPAMTVHQYTESTVYIDLIDRAKNQLVWQGKGTDEFNASEQNKDARIRETVTRILEQYPYGRNE